MDMSLFFLVFLVPGLVLGTLFSLWKNKIPHWLILAIIITGFYAQIHCYQWIGICYGLFGMVLGLVFAGPFYWEKMTKAGSVKYMAAIGLWLGWPHIFWTALFVLGLVVIREIYAEKNSPAIREKIPDGVLISIGTAIALVIYYAAMNSV